MYMNANGITSFPSLISLFIIVILIEIKAAGKCGYVNANLFQNVLNKCDVYDGTSSKLECTNDGTTVVSIWYPDNAECQGLGSGTPWNVTTDPSYFECEGDDCLYMEFETYTVTEDTKESADCKPDEENMMISGHYLQNYCLPTGDGGYYKFLCAKSDHVNKTYYSDALCFHQTESEDYHIREGCVYTQNDTDGVVTAEQYNKVICGSRDEANVQSFVMCFMIVLIHFVFVYL